MTDTFDALIDNVVESAKECENEHEHRGFYTESIKKNHDAARSALREAIDEVVKRATRAEVEAGLQRRMSFEYQQRCRTLEAELKEAEGQYRALLEIIANSRPCHPGEPAYDLIISKSTIDKGFEFLSRLSKRGQG